jgi:hypothetical protein
MLSKNDYNNETCFDGKIGIIRQATVSIIVANKLWTSMIIAYMIYPNIHSTLTYLFSLLNTLHKDHHIKFPE